MTARARTSRRTTSNQVTVWRTAAWWTSRSGSWARKILVVRGRHLGGMGVGPFERCDWLADHGDGGRDEAGGAVVIDLAGVAEGAESPPRRWASWRKQGVVVVGRGAAAVVGSERRTAGPGWAKARSRSGRPSTSSRRESGDRPRNTCGGGYIVRSSSTAASIIRSARASRSAPHPGRDGEPVPRSGGLGYLSHAVRPALSTLAPSSTRGQPRSVEPSPKVRGRESSV
jgi:hypothetical protein